MSSTAIAPRSAARGFRLDSLLRARELGIGLAIIVVFAFTTLNNHDFARAASVQQLLIGAALIALLGVGETMFIVTRNVDLSVGSVVELSAYVVVGLFQHDHHMPILLLFCVGTALRPESSAIT